MAVGIPFVHKIDARATKIKIRLENDGTVVVVTPPRFPKWRIPHYIEEAREWIKAHQSQLQSKPKLMDDSSLLYFGERYSLVVTKHMDGSITVKEKEIHIAPLSLTKGAQEKLLEKWIKARAIEYIVKRTEELAKLMKVTYTNILFREQKTRWGSCSSDKRLSFNWRLIHAPKEVIDYVIIHELAHTVHMNHGRRFWDLVAEFDPDHPLHRGWLKRYGSTAD
jgi:predicted metal-dependent hydrolase